MKKLNIAAATSALLEQMRKRLAKKTGLCPSAAREWVGRGNEYVQVGRGKGLPPWTKRVCVTADSLRAMAFDAVRAI